MKPIAILTGGSRGIGQAILQRLILDDYDCLVLGLSPLKGEQALQAHQVQCDLSTTAGIQIAIDGITRYLTNRGRSAELLINNAGGGWPLKIEELTLNSIQAELTLNLVAAMLLSHVVLPEMRLAGRGCIVNIGSTAGRRGVPFLHAYSASKAGLIAFTQSLAAETANDGVRVNCICPGAVKTESAVAGRLELARLHGLDPTEYERRMVDRNGLGRLITPAEVAAVVVWLTHPEQHAVNGQTINVCGILEME